MPLQIIIDDLSRHPEWIPDIARAQFDLWGTLRGFETCDNYACFLDGAAHGKGIPSTLVAAQGNTLLGSANLVNADMMCRPALTPWLAQVLVFPAFRRQGIGAMLIRAVSDRARILRYRRLHLFTSGDLREAWMALERMRRVPRERTNHYAF
jgi:GNAT superfamily N-acetyltransferase